MKKCVTRMFGKNRTPPCGGGGFTLLEMSIVIAIIAIVGVAGIRMFLGTLERHQRDETLTKLAAIQQMLYNYRIAYNRLPCPAGLTYTTGSQYFGKEAAVPGTCTGGTPAADFINSDGTDFDPVEGMVPTKTLGLPDDYAIDGWGRKITYAVSKDMTQNYAFYIVSVNTLDTRMTVKDASGATKTALATYVLVSYGPNGHGAYPRSASTRYSALSTNLDEKQNCDCSSAAAPSGLDGIFVQKLPTVNTSDPLDSFDDVVVYGTRADLRSVSE